MILRHTFTRSRDAARAGLRYYQLRPRGEEEPPRQIFDRERTLTRAEAHRLLDEHQVGGGYLVHRLMLSPEAGETPADLRAMARRTLRQLEHEKGAALHWVAVEHHNTAHPHVHILLAGGGDRAGDDGARRVEVRLDRADHARVKADARAYCREEARDRDGWARALDAAARDDAGSRAPARERAVRERDDGEWSP